MLLLEGKNAVITGGSRGIGRAIVARFAKEGANVAIVYAGNEAAANETCALAQEYGVTAKAYRCDVASFEQTQSTVESILKDFGKIDILVNNAGIVRDALVLSMKEEDFDAVLQTNLKGAFNMIKHCYGKFMRQRSGRIINITSVSGLMGNAGQANYAAAKAGLIGLTKTVAKELAGRHVTCNAIAPGFVQTDMTAELNDKVIETASAAIPMKRLGSPEDIANAVLFLAGEGAGYITGVVLRVDGGLSM